MVDVVAEVQQDVVVQQGDGGAVVADREVVSVVNVEAAPSVVVLQQDGDLVVVTQDEVQVVETPGEQGPPGPASGVSEDAGNRARYGSDAGVYVPEWAGTDPLAYYILARA